MTAQSPTYPPQPENWSDEHAQCILTAELIKLQKLCEDIDEQAEAVILDKFGGIW